MNRLIKVALLGIASVVLVLLLTGGLSLLREHVADLVVFAAFLAGIFLISSELTRKGRSKR